MSEVPKKMSAEERLFNDLLHGLCEGFGPATMCKYLNTARAWQYSCENQQFKKELCVPRLHWLIKIIVNNSDNLIALCPEKEEVK